ncbi:MAG: hypothetical protein ACQESG_04575 [Nanobdellota archaeon]
MIYEEEQFPSLPGSHIKYNYLKLTNRGSDSWSMDWCTTKEFNDFISYRNSILEEAAAQAGD